MINKNNIKFRKISFVEFDKLYHLFPEDYSSWIKYKSERLKELKNNETDTYIIDNNGIFIGEITVNYKSHDLELETIANKRVYLQALRIDRQYQGHGFAQKLFEYIINDLKSKGYSEFTLGVEEDNYIAKHIYEKYGFNEAICKGNGKNFDLDQYTLYLKKD